MNAKSKLLAEYVKLAPEWAVFVTIDKNGVIHAHESEPTLTFGGLYFSTARSECLYRPRANPECVRVAR